MYTGYEKYVYKSSWIPGITHDVCCVQPKSKKVKKGVVINKQRSQQPRRQQPRQQQPRRLYKNINNSDDDDDDEWPYEWPCGLQNENIYGRGVFGGRGVKLIPYIGAFLIRSV